MSCPLTILLFGSLGPNPDRIISLRERGHKVIYVYTESSPGLREIVPHLRCIQLPRFNLASTIDDLVKRNDCDVVYSLLNAHDGSTEATLALLDHGISVPIVRHYKEHPCVRTYEERRILLETDGQIYINEESFQYFKNAYGVSESSVHIMDGDLISRRHMTNSFSPKLRALDGEFHVLIAGGLSIGGDRLDMRDLCQEMARRKVHTHLYGYPRAISATGYPIIPDLPTAIEYEAMAEAASYIHLHQYIAPTQFVSEWSRYDAGLMHARVPCGHDQAAFQRLNFAHRYTAYLAAGLPLAIQEGGQDSMQHFIRTEGVGFVFSDYDAFVEQLANASTIGETVRSRRTRYSFEEHVDGLVAFFRQVCRRR
jgi:hypothetical protein